MTFLSCTGNEKKLIDCSFIKFPFFVFHSNDAGVKCFNDTTGNAHAFTKLETVISNGVVGGVCTLGEVRLVGGPTNSSGRVEVCFDGQWGTLCGDRNSSSTANVICTQLGFASQGMIL